MRPPAYVLWMGPTGLTIARSLGRHGVPVVGLHHNPNEPCVRTRYAQTAILPRIEQDESAWLAFLMDQARAHPGERPVLFPAGDRFWTFLARHRRELSASFRLAMPEAGDLEQWPTKSYQDALAARIGVPTPQTRQPSTVQDLRAWAPELTYPCLLKPVSTPEWFARYGQKLTCVLTSEELVRRGSEAMAAGLPFLIQQYIPGGDDHIIALYSYADRQSRIVAGCVSHKLRQYPPRFGCSSISQSADDLEVWRLAQTMVLGLGFHGISSVEFKRDARDGRLYLMEVNLRAPLMMGAIVDAGADLPWAAYRDLCGEPVRPVQPRVGRKVFLFEDDYRTFRLTHRLEGLTWGRWLRSLLGARELHFAWDDLRPFLAMVRRLVWRLRHEPDAPGIVTILAARAALERGTALRVDGLTLRTDAAARRAQNQPPGRTPSRVTPT
jgi:predicted ATP-grasp superfamily ATP-dependent carboligase